jgi:Ca2+-binding EF-hand superfamily protein
MGPGAMMGPGMMMGGGGMMGGGMGHGMMHMMTIMMDADGDGAVSREEYQAVHARMFDAMDLDKDGKLTSEEMQEFMQGGSTTPDENQ